MHHIEAFVSTLVPGQLCNVESEPDRKPLMRVVTKVERRKKNGRDWLFWYWIPGEDLVPVGDLICRRGMADPGYSGVAMLDLRHISVKEAKEYASRCGLELTARTREQVAREIARQITPQCAHDWHPVIDTEDEKLEQCVTCGDLRDAPVLAAAEELR